MKFTYNSLEKKDNKFKAVTLTKEDTLCNEVGKTR